MLFIYLNLLFFLYLPFCSQLLLLPLCSISLVFKEKEIVKLWTTMFSTQRRF